MQTLTDPRPPSGQSRSQPIRNSLKFMVESLRREKKFLFNESDFKFFKVFNREPTRALLRVSFQHFFVFFLTLACLAGIVVAFFLPLMMPIKFPMDFAIIQVDAWITERCLLFFYNESLLFHHPSVYILRSSPLPFIISSANISWCEWLTPSSLLAMGRVANIKN